ncbi:TPA: hypothetical protein I9236_002171 [Citrobacter freundii]|uniref:Uncharacterized protein n=1 Tax=Citrobacter portucalensis TaxID=1639133 RepID=A0ABD5H406_9ENTR|nr:MULTISPECIES: hypothetical protein [Citrobacter]EKY0310202.1 hypothetical protein [Citrobacter freundii]MBJ9065098.1 hypothetical protein [Citrobacter freundii]MBJ9097102.1 hypothetical protein [Citrobacter freundii]MBJ9114858.1 hypothetical protein [Citrobacter freundii]MBJ9124649.1 hypothetical protein [Citrobacter freundii]
MNHIEFIEKHVREELVRQGFTAAVAQGGHFRLSICTSACLRQVAKGGFLMMFCVTRNYGQKNRRCRRIDLKLSALSAVVSKGCSEKVKTVVRQHSQSSGVTPGRNYEVIMTNACTKHQAKGA